MIFSWKQAISSDIDLSKADEHVPHLAVRKVQIFSMPIINMSLKAT